MTRATHSTNLLIVLFIFVIFISSYAGSDIIIYFSQYCLRPLVRIAQYLVTVNTTVTCAGPSRICDGCRLYKCRRFHCLRNGKPQLMPSMGVSLTVSWRVGAAYCCVALALLLRERLQSRRVSHASRCIVGISSTSQQVFFALEQMSSRL